MDAKLRRELDAIARDNESGAAELALRAARAIQHWARGNPKPEPAHLVNVALAVMSSQPLMAPMLRLGNEVALAAKARNSSRALRRRVTRFANILATSPARIGFLLAKALPPKPDNRVATYSYSSTVVAALIRAKSRISGVYCSEARPACEGRKTAALLAKAGIDVLFCTDAELLSGFGTWTHLIVGADAVYPDGFRNKQGTGVLIDRARERKARVWILTDTTKLNPWITAPPGFEWLAHQEELKVRQSDWGRASGIRLVHPKKTEVWKNAPRRVWAMGGGAFEYISFRRGMQLLTEQGWMTPKQVIEFMRRTKVSRQFRVAGKLIA